MSSILEKFLTKMNRDGVDHVRISPRGETHIGRICFHDWRKTFFVPDMGSFLTPVCFANWMASGNEDARHDQDFRVRADIHGWRDYVLYAKFYQLCSMATSVRRDMLDLPFVAYKQHESGIKEFDRWKEYPSEIKAMIEHIVDPARGPKVPYNWDERLPGLKRRIDERLALFVEAMRPIKDEAQPATQPKPKNKNKRPRHHQKRHHQDAPQSEQAAQTAQGDHQEQAAVVAEVNHPVDTQYPPLEQQPTACASEQPSLNVVEPEAATAEVQAPQTDVAAQADIQTSTAESV